MYRSKTQTVIATLFTEAEFIAAVQAAKHAKYLPAIMSDLGFAQQGPTPIYADNMSAIKMINARVPTQRSRHIDIQHFAILEWCDNGDIIMEHIPGIICPPDALTKALGWILHHRHVRRLMGHTPSTDSSVSDTAECKSLRPPTQPLNPSIQDYQARFGTSRFDNRLPACDTD